MRHLAFSSLGQLPVFRLLFRFQNFVKISFFVIVVAYFTILFVLVGLGLSCSLTIILVKFSLGAEVNVQLRCHLKHEGRDFPGGPVVKTPHFQCGGCRFDPWSGN